MSNSLPLNPFTSVRHRGIDAPAKRPTKRKKPVRVLNAAGKWQAYLEPARHSIVIESRAEAQASNDKTRAITRGLS